jgi:predicted transcriptional regulator
MYHAMLSFTELQEYLLELEHLQLIEFNENTRLYYITNKGTRYLEIYYRMKDMASEI